MLTAFRIRIWQEMQSSFSNTIRLRLTGCVSRYSAVRFFSSPASEDTPMYAAKKAPSDPKDIAAFQTVESHQFSKFRRSMPKASVKLPMEENGRV